MGTSEFVLRLFSVITAVLTIIPLYFLTKQLFDRKTAETAALLFPFNVLFIKVAQLARGYSLLLFLTTTLSYLIIRLEKKYSYKLQFIYILTSVFAIYTHLFAIFVILSHFFYTAYKVKSNFRKLFFGFIIIAVLSTPLILSPSSRSGQIDWINTPNLKTLITTAVFLAYDYLPISILSIALVIFRLIKFKQINKKNEILFLLFSLTFPILLTFIFSILIKPIYNLQYFIICLVPLITLLSYSIVTISNRNLIKLITLILIIGSCTRLFYWYNEMILPYQTINNRNSEWQKTVQYITDNANKGDSVIIYPPFNQLVFNYYSNNFNNSIPLLDLQPNNLITAKQSTFNTALLEGLPFHNSKIWLIEDNSLLQNEEQHSMIIRYLKSRYTLKKQSFNYQIVISKYEN